MKELTTKLNRFSELVDQKTELEAQLNEVKAQKSSLEFEIIQEMQSVEPPIQKLTIGDYTFSPRRDLTVALADGAAYSMFVDRAFEDADEEIKAMATINHRTLQAYLKEKLYRAELGTWEVDPSRLPERIRDLIKVGERVTLGRTKAG